jgi:hypothetical protein
MEAHDEQPGLSAANLRNALIGLAIVAIAVLAYCFL